MLCAIHRFIVSLLFFHAFIGLSSEATTTKKRWELKRLAKRRGVQDGTTTTTNEERKKRCVWCRKLYECACFTVYYYKMGYFQRISNSISSSLCLSLFHSVSSRTSTHFVSFSACIPIKLLRKNGRQTQAKLEKRIFNRILWHRKCNYKGGCFFSPLICSVRSFAQQRQNGIEIIKYERIRVRLFYFIFWYERRKKMWRTMMKIKKKKHKIAHLLFSFSSLNSHLIHMLTRAEKQSEYFYS